MKLLFIRHGDPDYTIGTAIHDFGFPRYIESEGVITCASVVATDSMAEGKIFPPRSSTISKPELKEVYLKTEIPPIRRKRTMIAPTTSRL